MIVTAWVWTVTHSSSKQLPVQSQQQKHILGKGVNYSNVNIKDTRKNTIASFWCLHCYLWTYLTPFPSVSAVTFEYVFVSCTEYDAIIYREIKNIKLRFWALVKQYYRISCNWRIFFTCSTYNYLFGIF